MDEKLNNMTVVELLKYRTNGVLTQETIENIYKKIGREIEIEENNLLIYLLESEVYYAFAVADDKVQKLEDILNNYTFEEYDKLINILSYDHPAKIFWKAIRSKIGDESKYNKYVAKIKDQLNAYGSNNYMIEIREIHSEESLNSFCQRIISYNIEPENDDDKISNNQKVEEEF